MTMITPSYLGETIEYSSLHACRSTLEDPTLYTVFWVETRNFFPYAQNAILLLSNERFLKQSHACLERIRRDLLLVNVQRCGHLLVPQQCLRNSVVAAYGLNHCHTRATPTGIQTLPRYT